MIPLDMSQIQTVAGALGTIKDLFKLGIEAKADAQSQARILEAMGKLGDAQQALLGVQAQLYDLQAKNQELRQAVDDRAAFDARFAQYELTKTAGNAVVYKSKFEPAHYACPNCINARRIEPLQDNRTIRGKYRCTAPGCGAEFPIDPPQRTELAPTPPTTNFWSR